MELYCKTYEECIGGCYKRNGEHCLPDDEDHKTNNPK